MKDYRIVQFSGRTVALTSPVFAAFVLKLERR